MKEKNKSVAAFILAASFSVMLSACTTFSIRQGTQLKQAEQVVNVKSPAKPENKPKAEPDNQKEFSFVVIGDTPYNEDDKTMLKVAIKKIAETRPPFIIHIGDTQSGDESCGAAQDERFAKLISDLAPVPVYYTPGDNEWTDCDRQTIKDTGVRFSEIGRLNLLRDTFFAKPPAHSHNMSYAQLYVQPENASWVYNNIRFMTLNVPGTGNARTQVLGDPLLQAKQEAELRDAANLYWIKTQFAAATTDTYGKPLANPAKAIVIAMQADMTDFSDKEQHLIGKPCVGVSDEWRINCDGFIALRKAIAQAAQGFDGPVLLIHGDTSPFTLNQEFLGSEVDNLWRLNAAGDTWVNKKTGDSGGVRDVTVVTIDLGNEQEPFSATGLIAGAIPGS